MLVGRKKEISLLIVPELLNLFPSEFDCQIKPLVLSGNLEQAGKCFGNKCVVI